MAAVISMRIHGTFRKFQQEEVERILLQAQAGGIIEGAEYCNVCDDRENCVARQGLVVVWLECRVFVLSTAKLQRIAEDLHDNAMQHRNIAS